MTTASEPARRSIVSPTVCWTAQYPARGMIWSRLTWSPDDPLAVCADIWDTSPRPPARWYFARSLVSDAFNYPGEAGECDVVLCFDSARGVLYLTLSSNDGTMSLGTREILKVCEFLRRSYEAVGIDDETAAVHRAVDRELGWVC